MDAAGISTSGRIRFQENETHQRDLGVHVYRTNIENPPLTEIRKSSDRTTTT